MAAFQEQKRPGGGASDVDQLPLAESTPLSYFVFSLLSCFPLGEQNRSYPLLSICTVTLTPSDHAQCDCEHAHVAVSASLLHAVGSSHCPQCCSARRPVHPPPTHAHNDVMMVPLLCDVITFPAIGDDRIICTSIAPLTTVLPFATVLLLTITQSNVPFLGGHPRGRDVPSSKNPPTATER